MAQLLVILQILISQRQAKHPLPNQRTHSVLDQLGAAMVGKATGQPVDQADGCIGLAQQQGAGIAADRAAVKRGYNFCWPGLYETAQMARRTAHGPDARFCDVETA